RNRGELVVGVVVRPRQPVESRALEPADGAEGGPGHRQPDRSGGAGLEQAGTGDAPFVDAHVFSSSGGRVAGSGTASSGSHQSVTSWSSCRLRSAVRSRPKSEARTGVSRPSHATATLV